MTSRDHIFFCFIALGKEITLIIILFLFRTVHLSHTTGEEEEEMDEDKEDKEEENDDDLVIDPNV